MAKSKKHDYEIGDIYGVFYKDEGGYHPYIIIGVSHQKVYTIQGSSLKVLPLKHPWSQPELTNYFQENDYEYYILKEYDDTGLKYQTAFNTSWFVWDEDIKDKNYLGYCQYKDIRQILIQMYQYYKTFNNEEIGEFNQSDGIKYQQFLILLEESIDLLKKIYFA